MRKIFKFDSMLAIIGVMLIAACAQIGMAPLDTFNKRADAGFLAIQTISESTATAALAGKVSKSDAQNVVTVGTASINAINIAKQMQKEACPDTSPTAAPCTSTAAENKLKATLAILTALQSYLATQTQGTK